jgi:outer membrane cobalamin receptor
VLILFFFCSNQIEIFSQQRLTTEEERKLKEEELEEGNNPQVADTTKFVMDTVGLRKPLKNHTKIILGQHSPYKTISKHDILFKSYYTFFEIFKSSNIGYPLSLGFPGMNNSISLAGSFLGGTNIRLGGNNLNDFETGIANLSLLSVESFELAEIFLGSDAVIFGNNSTGSLINIQEVIHNTYVPYTKLWYSQGSNELIAADGTFSQNFAKNFNIDFGFRSIHSPGRFTNQSLQSWNLRLKLRWNPSDLTSISFSENYSNYGIGENGGNSKENSGNIFDEIESIPILNKSSSRLFRNNLNLNISTYLDSTKHFGIISNTAFVHSDKTFKDGNFIFSIPADSLDKLQYSDYVLSNRTQIETNLGSIGAIAGEEISYNKFSQNRYFADESYFNLALFGLFKMNLFETIELTGGARYFNQFGKNGISVGAKLRIKIDSSRTFFGDISKSDRVPSLFEGKGLESEHHYLILAGLDWLIGGVKLELLGFARQVDLPIQFAYSFDTTSQSYSTKFSNGSNMRIFGIEGNLDFSIFKNIYVNSFVKTYFSQLNSENKNVLPKLFSGLRIYYKVVAGKSELHAGLDYELLFAGGGMSYFPGYSTNYFIDDQSGLMGNGLNLFIEGKLGDTYLKASFNNVLGQGYYFTPYYPELGRHFNLTFSWAFLD